jgi:hypothetical protein
MLRFCHWTLLALAEGKYPSSRHDNKPWTQNDSSRMLLAASLLPFKGCIVHIKGDWSEYAGTLGFPTWHDGLRPCFECPAFGESMFTPVGHAIGSLAWICNGDAEYEDACQRCEITVRLDLASRAKVLALLRPDKRQHGARGLALVGPVPELNLLTDDRLEPSPSLPDVDGLAAAELPIEVIFWRKANDTLTRHRNPLFCDALGLSPRRNLTVDELHAVNLGVMNVYCKTVIWFILLGGVYGALGTREENVASAVLGFRHDLMIWYKTALIPNLTRVSNFKPKMIGTSAEPKCKTKGAETWGMLLFILAMLTRHANNLGERGARYLAAGEALRRVVDIWRENANRVPTAAIQDTRGEHGTTPKHKSYCEYFGILAL